MHTRTKVAATMLIAAVMLASAVAGASANRFRVSGTTFRIVWSEMTFRTNGGSRIVCPVTLEGAFESLTFVKRSGLRIGTVIRAVSGCPSSIRFLLPAAWNVQYESFTGSLPNPGTMLFKIPLFELEWIGGFFGYSCLWRTTAVFTATRNSTTAQLTRVDPTTFPIQAFSGPLCWIERDTLSISGSGVMTVVGEGAGVFLSLI